MSGKSNVVMFASLFMLVAVIMSCSEDTNYDQRTVVYVSSINGDSPFICDVLSQGDSLYDDGVSVQDERRLHHRGLWSRSFSTTSRTARSSSPAPARSGTFS